MTKEISADRRHSDRRRPADSPADLRSTTDACHRPPLFDSEFIPAGRRYSAERRVAERRKVNVGPPSGMDERRIVPDLRGEIFPIYFNQN